MSEPEEEHVDGAQIAADILLKMAPKRRERILNLMRAKSPTDTGKVTRKINSMSRLLVVDSKSLEAALRRAADYDIALALKTESDELKTHLLKHVSQRRQEIISTTLKELPPTPLRAVLLAQERLISTLDMGLEVVG